MILANEEVWTVETTKSQENAFYGEYVDNFIEVSEEVSQNIIDDDVTAESPKRLNEENEVESEPGSSFIQENDSIKHNAVMDIYKHYKFDLNKLPQTVKSQIDKKKKLNPQETTQLVHNIVGDLRGTSKYIPKIIFQNICTSLANDNPETFKPKAGGSFLLEYCPSLLTKLINHNNHLNRQFRAIKPKNQIKLKDTKKMKFMRESTVNGCFSASDDDFEKMEVIKNQLIEMYVLQNGGEVVNMEQVELMMKNCFHSIKAFTETKSSWKIEDILSNFPFITEKSCMEIYFKELMNHPLQNLTRNLESMSNRIVQHFTKTKCVGKGFHSYYKAIELIATHFKEDKENLIQVFQVRY